MKTRSSAARAARSRTSSSSRLRRVDLEHALQPLALPGERAEEDRGRLGRDEVGVAEQPRQRLGEAEVVDAVPELVEHRVGPVLVVGHVREHAHVAGAVDVDAERVLVLSGARIEVAAIEDLRRPRGRALESATRKRDDVLPLEQRVEVDRAVTRALLEERVRVVPGAKLRDGAAEALGQPRVERALPARERLRRHAVALIERREQLRLVELVDREREREPVAVAERARRLVAEARELADVVRDLGADRLRRLPRLTPLARVVALAQDPLDLVVVDLAARDHAAVSGETSLDRRTRARRYGRAASPGAGAEASTRAGARGCGRTPVAVRASRALDLGEELTIGERVGVRELGRRRAASRSPRSPRRSMSHHAVLRARVSGWRRSSAAATRGCTRRSISGSGLAECASFSLEINHFYSHGRRVAAPWRHARRTRPPLCELHAHSPGATASWRRRACRPHGRNGFDVLCVTDHVIRTNDAAELA